MEKRSSEAYALREFFGEQWRYLLQLIQGSQRRRDDELIQDKHLTDAVEHIVDKVDARIRGVGSYQQLLRSSAHELLVYIQNMIDEMPDAITIDKRSYVSEPLINAIFASNNELESLLSKSDEIQNFVKESKSEKDRAIYALLFVMKEEKPIFGSEIRENLIQRDVQQTAVNFYGHKITAPALSEQAVRSSIKRILFESVVATIRSNMVKLRYSLSLEEQQRAALNPEQNINNPETYLRLLTEQLGMPKNVISLQSSMIRVSKMGIKRSSESNELSNEFTLNEVEIGKSNIRAITLVQFNWSDWL